MSVVFTFQSTPDVVVTISKNPSYSSDFYHKRLNQETERTADGGRSTYDNGPNELHGILMIKNVSKAEADALRTWIHTTINFALQPFGIAPPANTDIGGGVGTTLTSCYWDGPPDTDGNFVYNAPGIYDIKFPYTKVIT